MTQAGGSAAINGFLYQILQHLGWVAELSLSQTINGVRVEDGARLVLEPRKGGDARSESSNHVVTEQYKSRADGTWAIGDFEDVLRDLRKAVPAARPDDAHYRFVTDGRPGRLDTFREFLVAVKGVKAREELDDTKTKDFGRDQLRTDRGNFDHLAKATRSADVTVGTDEDGEMLHLLSRFEMEFAVSAEAKAHDVETLLRPYTQNLGEEREVRTRMVGMLMEMLSEGEVRLDKDGVDNFLRDAGLNPGRMQRAARLLDVMNAATEERLKQQVLYQGERDVRDAPRWPAERPILLISGKSGSGKSWQLARLLKSLAEVRQIATLVTPADNAETTLQRAARNIWQRGLGDTTDKTLQALTWHYQELVPNAASPWLTVALDDVRAIDLARDLVQQDWNALKMRLVIAVPAAVGRALELSFQQSVHHHRVENFSVDELDKVLGLSNRRWVDLPFDMKNQLRNPLLAGLYISLPYASAQTAPRSEYEVFARFWERVTKTGHPGDEGIVLALAAHVRNGEPYPLGRAAWHEIGLTEDRQLERLEAAGWFSCVEGDISFAHDRLLNWAVAKWLAQRFARKALTAKQLSQWVLDLDVAGNPMGSRLRRRREPRPDVAIGLCANGPSLASVRRRRERGGGSRAGILLGGEHRIWQLRREAL
jgi:hypothetical protein